MWRDRWLVLEIVGAVAGCLACLTPAAVAALGAIGLGAWTDGRCICSATQTRISCCRIVVRRTRQSW